MWLVFLCYLAQAICPWGIFTWNLKLKVEVVLAGFKRNQYKYMYLNWDLPDFMLSKEYFILKFGQRISFFMEQYVKWQLWCPDFVQSVQLLSKSQDGLNPFCLQKCVSLHMAHFSGLATCIFNLFSSCLWTTRKKWRGKREIVQVLGISWTFSAFPSAAPLLDGVLRETMAKEQLLGREKKCWGRV